MCFSIKQSHFQPTLLISILLAPLGRQLWSTACSLTFSRSLCREWAAVSDVMFNSLIPPLLPVFSLLWDCWTVNPQDFNVHRINGVLSKNFVRRPPLTAWLSLEVEHYPCSMQTQRTKKAAYSGADWNENKSSLPVPYHLQHRAEAHPQQIVLRAVISSQFQQEVTLSC